MNIRTTIRPLAEKAGVIDIQGEMSSAAEGVLMEAYQSLVEQGKTQIILNFSGMDYMNSSGIGLLVTLFIRSSGNSHQLAIVELRPHFRRVFELTRLQSVIPIFVSEADALRNLSHPGL